MSISASISGCPTARNCDVKSRSLISSAPVRISSKGTKNERTRRNPKVIDNAKSASTARSHNRFSRRTKYEIAPSTPWINTRYATILARRETPRASGFMRMQPVFFEPPVECRPREAERFGDAGDVAFEVAHAFDDHRFF